MTTLTSPELTVATEQPLRIPRIAANLLPPEVTDARRSGRIRRIVLVALASFALLVGAWYAGASFLTAEARDDLAVVQEDVRRVQRQQEEFSELTQVQTEMKMISARLQILLAQDLQWKNVLNTVRGAAPTGVQVTGLTAQVARDSAAGSGAATVQLPNPTGDTAIGEVTLTGYAPDKEAVAAYVDALAKQKAVGNPMLIGTVLQNESFQFTIRVEITTKALGGRYTAQRPTVPGVK